MRMDRYEEDNNDSSKKSRADKNQELYTDVYLNNAYVDISEINEVVNDNGEDYNNIKKKIETEPINYSYQEKNYDINELISIAIENNNDNLKRSLEQTTEIDNIIKTINENQLEKEKENNLLSDLLSDSDTTTIVKTLDTVITDTKELDTSVIHKDEMSNELLNEFEDTKDNTLSIEPKNIQNETEEEIDESLSLETKKSKKVIFIIIGIVLVIAIVVGILIYKKIIKF